MKLVANSLVLSTLLCCAFSVTALDKVVENPDFKFRTDGPLEVNKVELNDSAMTLFCTVRFFPKRTITVNDNLVVKADDKTYKPVSISGLTLGREFHMPESGSHQFAITYPAINADCDVIDVLELGPSWNIDGIRLDGQKYDKPDREKWIENHKSDFQGNDKSEILAVPETVTFEGVINGYDAKSFGSNFLIFRSDDFFDGSEPLVVPVADDGSFKVEFEMYRPRYIDVAFPGGFYSMFYLEPGRNISVFYDLDLFLQQRAGVATNKSAVINGGDLGPVNNALQASPNVWTLINPHEIGLDNSIEQAAWFILSQYYERQKKLEKYIADYDVNNHAARLLRAKLRSWLANQKLEYATIRESLSKMKNEGDVQFPDDYFDFVKEDFNDADVIATKEFFRYIQLINNIDGYRRKVGIPSATDDVVSDLQNEAIATKKYLETDELPLWMQMKTAAQLTSQNGKLAVTDVTEKDVKSVLSKLRKNKVLTDNRLNAELENYYKSAYSKMELPDNEAGNLVKSMIEPYKGKYVLINMFTPLIPESRSEIEFTKGFRQKNQDNKDFKVIYAVSEELIFPQQFDLFVKTEMPGDNIKRLPAYKYNLLRSLFEFHMIPHYVLIDRNGTVIAKHFGNMQSFMKFLDSKGIQYKL